MGTKKQPDTPRHVYKWHLDCGRMGSLEGIFTATEYEVETSFGIKAHFGEVLGKHSEITAVLKEAQFAVVNTPPGFVATFDELDLSNGHNPLCYITCANCGYILDAPYKKCSRRACGWKRGE